MRACKIEFDGEDLFVIYNGMKIAKRGEPGTPHAKTWISLEPGDTVRDTEDGAIEIEFQRKLTVVQ